MIGYLDSSVILRKLFNEPHPFEDVQPYTGFVSSALLKTECLRVLSRLRLSNRVSVDQVLALQSSFHILLQSISIIPVTQEILDRAGEDFPTSLKTLDAIHFSTFIIYSKEVQTHMRNQVVLITHDINLGKTARAMGLVSTGF